MSRTKAVQRSSRTGTSSPVTHESYIHAIRETVVPRLNEEDVRLRLLNAKLVYGSGQRGFRGACYYEAWEKGQRHEFIEVCAFGEQSSVQLAVTTLHELAHALAGDQAGHGPEWKAAAKKLGLIHAEAAGQNYHPLHFDPAVWESVSNLPLPTDGRPVTEQRESPSSLGMPPTVNGPSVIRPHGGKRAIRPCPAGIGTRGGKSRGPGSGSRLIKLTCPHCEYAVWTTEKWIKKGAPRCPGVPWCPSVAPMELDFGKPRVKPQAKFRQGD